jgi:hypothetical protein
LAGVQSHLRRGVRRSPPGSVGHAGAASL